MFFFFSCLGFYQWQSLLLCSYLSYIQNMSLNKKLNILLPGNWNSQPFRTIYSFHELPDNDDHKIDFRCICFVWGLMNGQWQFLFPLVDLLLAYKCLEMPANALKWLLSSFLNSMGHLPSLIRFWCLFVSKKTPNNTVTSEARLYQCSGQWVQSS